MNEVHVDKQTDTIKAMVINGVRYNLSPSTISNDTYNSLLEKLTAEFSKKPIIEHKCRNCGAILEMDMNRPIFICKYCGSTYAVGTSMINDKGE